jgi:hypothetical protein
VTVDRQSSLEGRENRLSARPNGQDFSAFQLSLESFQVVKCKEQAIGLFSSDGTRDLVGHTMGFGSFRQTCESPLGQETMASSW